MGQYYKIVNIDKKQFLHPHTFGDGLKLLEFGCNSMGVLTGLTILLADGNNRGGGDLRSDHPLIGSWVGDRVIVAGDYADPNLAQYTPEEVEELKTDLPEQADDSINLYRIATYLYEDISKKVIEVLKCDPYLEKELRHR